MLATNIGLRLRDSFDEKGATYWYRRRYFVLMERLNLISLEDPHWAGTLRMYMRNHFGPQDD